MNTYNDTHNCNNTTFPLHFWSFFPWYALFVTCLIKHLSPYQLMNFTFVPFNDDHDLTNRPKVLLVAIEIALVIRLSLFIGKTFYFLFHFFLSVFFSLFFVPLFLHSYFYKVSVKYLSTANKIYCDICANFIMVAAIIVQCTPHVLNSDKLVSLLY